MTHEEKTAGLKKIFEKDHKKIIELLNKVKSGRSRKMKYFLELSGYLLVHAEAEEECLFKHTGINTHLQKIKRQIKSWHELIRRQIQVITDTYADDDIWTERFEVLEFLVLKHQTEEDEELIPLIVKHGGKIDHEEIECIYEKITREKRKDAEEKVKKGIVLKESDMIEPGSVAMKNRDFS